MAKRKLSQKVIKEVNNYINILKADKLPISQVYVFGSYAKGRPNSYSDIDVCVVSPKFKNTFKALQYLWQKVPTNAHSSIEPIGLNPNDLKDRHSTLVSEIKKTGIKI